MYARSSLIGSTCITSCGMLDLRAHSHAPIHALYLHSCHDVDAVAGSGCVARAGRTSACADPAQPLQASNEPARQQHPQEELRLRPTSGQAALTPTSTPSRGSLEGVLATPATRGASTRSSPGCIIKWSCRARPSLPGFVGQAHRRKLVGSYELLVTQLVPS